jgi:hypothetical protein
MRERERTLAVGALAGLLGGALVLASVARLDRGLGGPLGLVAAAGLGAAAAGLVREDVRRRIARRLLTLSASPDGGSIPPPGLAGLDGMLESVG